MDIVEFENLLLEKLPASSEILSYTTKNLMESGENHGSILLQVGVSVKRGNGATEELNLVAKLCPPSELIKLLFNIPVTFKKEIRLYDTVVPTLMRFATERGCPNMINFFPKYYGSRMSVDKNSNQVDDNACLLLENLKVSGYVLCDRIQGFDLATARLLTKNLAAFHAVPIALKLTQPELFKNNALAHLENHTEHTAKFNDSLCDLILKMLKDCKEFEPYIDRIIDVMSRSKESQKYCAPREPFATISHNDFWVNNTMVKFDTNGNPISNMIVDFQLILYGNPADDLLFFIYSSLSRSIITAHYTELIDLYYDTFINTFKTLNVDCSQFTKERFLAEIDYSAKNRELFHILFMFRPIFTLKGAVGDPSEFDGDNALDNTHLAEEYMHKTRHTILDFIDKKWI